LADKKISQLTNLTGANLAENDEFVLVDTSADETKAITFGELKTAFDTGTGFVRVTGDTMTGNLTVPTVDINGGTIDGTVIGGTTPAAGNFTTGSFTGDVSFGDNDKAIFGAGSDLQIYHAGSASYIDDVGTGSLNVRGTNLFLRDASDNLMAGGIAGAEFRLYYDSATYSDPKLATTSTGVDVTGTITSDGLTVANDGALVWGTGGGRPAIIGNENTDDMDFYIQGNKAINISGGGDISFYEDTGTTPKFFWDASAESLGIGTTTPVTSIQVVESGGTPEIRLADGTNAAGLGVDTIPFVGAISNTSFAIKTNATERMRIDSSGNLLVGTTSSSSNTAGIKLTAAGTATFVRSGVQPVYINRLTSDGDLAVFAKDGSTVGSIGTAYSRPYFASTNCGISPHNTANYVAATNSTGTTIDNTVDLGAASYRWKDLYLSGGVYLGGTGSANKLDDYEEGEYDVTVTPETSGSISLYSTSDRFSYTKIGRMVHVNGWVQILSNSSAVGDYININLPFTLADLTDVSGRAGAGVVINDASTPDTVNVYGSYASEGTSTLSIFIDASTLSAGDDIIIDFNYNAA